MQAAIFSDFHVAENFPCFAIHFNDPSGCASGFVQRRHTCPERASAQLQRICAAEIWKFAEKLPVEIKALDAATFAIGDVDDVVLVDDD